MGIKNLARICESLIAHGKAPDTPAALVRWGTTPRQESLLSDLTNVADAVKKAGLKPPAVFVVGSVASLRGELDFFERKPLFGKRILVTRSREQSRKMADRIIELGGDPILLPTIKMVPPDDLRPLDDSLDRIGEYDWIIFTSVNGVEFFFRRFFERYDDLRLLAGPKFAAIGPITAAAIRARGLRAELTAKEFVAEGLLADFPEHEISGRRFLIPRAQKARDILPDGLTARGGAVDVVSVYKTVQPDAEEIRPVIASLGETRLDAITFTSSSTVTHFLHMIKGTGYEKAPLTAVASIGPITSKTLKDNDMAVDVEAGEYTIDGLIDALVEYFRTR
jgi:uroporphyrinogen III methyltransferase/synthase